MNLTFFTYKTFTYVIAINLQLFSVNVTVAVCFRLKCLMSKAFSQHFIDPDKSAYNIYSVQSSTNGITMSPKITSPELQSHFKIF